MLEQAVNVAACTNQRISSEIQDSQKLPSPFLHMLHKPDSAIIASTTATKKCEPPAGPPSFAKKAFVAAPRTKAKRKARQDPRMARAVEAKLADPNLPLRDALVNFGGFDFPAAKQTGENDAVVYDADGVSLRQRKNQLCRRVRAQRADVAITPG
mmetsp:Transcript_42051/g.127537  ORF Transcript_42051/g.127537 Transcript_42051/m.127537 type:complete len:155 (-) Transcript_42051:60-524(-)